MRWPFFILLVSIFGSFEPNLALAEEGTFSLEPLYTEVDISEADEEKAFTMALTNRTGSDSTFRLSAVDFGSLDESGGVAFLGKGDESGNRYGLASWIELENESVIVPAGETEEISVTIRNRESLSSGGHYGAIVFYLEEQGGGAGDSPMVSVNSSFASLIFAKKTGGETYELAYRGDVDSQGDFFGIPDKISLRFQNSGNTHLVPRGRVVVMDPFGRVVRKGILNEESSRILPESFRVYGVALKPVEKTFLPGPYTISVEYRYDGKDEITIASPERVVPFILNFLWAAGVVSIGVLLWKFSKKFLKKRKKNDNVE